MNEEEEMSMKEEDEMVEEKQVEGVKYYTPAYQYYPGFPSVVYPFQQVINHSLILTTTLLSTPRIYIIGGFKISTTLYKSLSHRLYG